MLLMIIIVDNNNTFSISALGSFIIIIRRKGSRMTIKKKRAMLGYLHERKNYSLCRLSCRHPSLCVLFATVLQTIPSIVVVLKDDSLYCCCTFFKDDSFYYCCTFPKTIPYIIVVLLL